MAAPASARPLHPLLLPDHHGALLRDGWDTPPAALLQSKDPHKDQPLSGLRLAVKDVFDVAGLRTGAGNPAWAEEQAPAVHTATAVQCLLQAGAGWVGKTVTDELTYSLAGINAHFGTPVNPLCPERLPGGSSSGSAVAVAAGYADIALGTDCGGSVRLPASYNGLWGLRPTHGRISGQGCFALAHSFDTVGWFARELAPLQQVLAVLAHTRPVAAEASTLWVAPAVAPLLDEAVQSPWAASLNQLARRHPVAELPLALDRRLALADWAAAFRSLQAAEVWQQHGGWFRRQGHTLGADVQLRFERAALVGAKEVVEAQRLRVEASRVLAQVLAAPGSLLLLPTVPGVAPRLDDSPAQIDQVRQRSQQLLCLAGLAGLPQLSFPWLRLAGAPVGLSLVGARGDDEAVLAVAGAVHAMLAATPS